MVIVSSFSLTYNNTLGFFTITAKESLTCPFCRGELVYRDSKPRKTKDIIGGVSHFLLRRLRCQGTCKKLHTELPDIIQPYKHYESSVIQAVINDSADAADCHADNSTIRRWKTEFEKAEPDIAQRLASVYAQTTDEIAPIETTCKILDTIKANCKRWLAFVMVLLINSGHKICTQFAFCLPESPDTVRSRSINDTKERGKKDDATIDDSS